MRRRIRTSRRERRVISECGVVTVLVVQTGEAAYQSAPLVMSGRCLV
jgi:hypothetical protein